MKGLNGTRSRLRDAQIADHAPAKRSSPFRGILVDVALCGSCGRETVRPAVIRLSNRRGPAS